MTAMASMGIIKVHCLCFKREQSKGFKLIFVFQDIFEDCAMTVI